MLGRAIQPEIEQLIGTKSFAQLKGAVAQMEVHDLAELLAELKDENLALVFRLLPHGCAAEVFGDLPLERQGELLETLSSEKVATILNEMPPDERTELLEELPGELVQRLLNALRGDQLKIARSLLNYPEDSIGRLMTPEYVAIRSGWGLAKVFEHIRNVGADRETVNVVYVVDDRWNLRDELTLEQLVLADPGATVADLMDEQCASLNAWEDQEEAIDQFRKYDALALPVVDSRGVLVGIVTVDDVMDVVEEEHTEDFQKMAAVATLESAYFQTSVPRMLAKRLPWLVLLFLAEILTVVALSSYQAQMDKALLAMMVGFVPLINACAGNTGSQMAGLMIRGFAVAELEMKDWHRVLTREFLQGAALGLVLGAMGFATALAFGKPIGLAIGVMVALVSVMTLANIMGSMLPFFFKRVGVDPAVTSGPFIASLMDVSAILIYFTVAAGILALVD
jgi:magnesium transporter